MHDNLAKVLHAQEEILPNPEEVVFRLLGDANSWPNSCMYEEEITADEILLQAASRTRGGWMEGSCRGQTRVLADLGRRFSIFGTSPYDNRVSSPP